MKKSNEFIFLSHYGFGQSWHRNAFMCAMENSNTGEIITNEKIEDSKPKLRGMKADMAIIDDFAVRRRS